MLNQLLNRDSSGLSASITGLQLNEWAPICNLPKRYQDEILNRSEVKEYKAGEMIFMAKGNDEKDYYLFEGSVEFINEKREQVKTTRHSGQQSLELIDHQRPRIYTVKAEENCKVFVTRRTFFDTLNSANSGKASLPEVEVSEIDMEGSGNWMLHMLNSSVFSNLPPENLQQIFINMDTVKVPAGSVIVKQGKPGDYFYLIQHGDCVISQQGKNGEKKELYHLGTGETFGERSLITGESSDVSVEMLSDGVVMRISKDNFNELVKEPLLDQISIDEANSLIEAGASWIDVRDADQYREQAIKNSLNIGLNNIYTAVKGLNINTKYVLCGNSPSHAMASAFLLSIKGFTVYSLSTSVEEYLESNPDAEISVQQVETQEAPVPVLETTVDEEHIPLLAETEQLEETADQPPQIKVNTVAISENIENISRDLEVQIRKEINDLFILKQKELEQEVSDKFKKYHLVTARIMKKKLDDLELVYQVQSKLRNKKTRQE